MDDPFGHTSDQLSLFTFFRQHLIGEHGRNLKARLSSTMTSPSMSDVATHFLFFQVREKFQLLRAHDYVPSTAGDRCRFKVGIVMYLKVHIDEVGRGEEGLVQPLPFQEFRRRRDICISAV